MTLLITGATGFVMSVLTRHWLEADPSAQVVALDSTTPDATATRYFASVADRLKVVVADVTQPDSWVPLLQGYGITEVVHGATVTPISRGTADEAQHEPEAYNPGRIIDVNIMGTVALLDWARTQRAVRRFLYVSSGSVYKHHGPDRPGEPLPEDGYVMPRRLYGISKFASELIAERYGDLFGLSTVAVRLSSVYGPMDRVTPSRNVRHPPNRIAHLCAAGASRVRVNSVAGVGDYIHAEDAARAMTALLQAPALRHSVYNIASGITTTLEELIAWAAIRAPGFHGEIVAANEAELVQDDTLRDGMWGAYDITRIIAETGWRPRPTKDAFLSYIDWLAAQ